MFLGTNASSMFVRGRLSLAYQTMIVDFPDAESWNFDSKRLKVGTIQKSHGFDYNGAIYNICQTENLLSDVLLMNFYVMEG